MSNLTRSAEQDCDFEEGCGALLQLIEPRDRELGGIPVRRSLPNRERQMVGPWIFFDHMGPVDFKPGEGVNIPPHPHIGICTVTYLFEGEVLHRDSLGSLQAIRPGEVNLMVAGRGVVHSERERDEVRSHSHRMHGLQLWLALPQEHEEDAPEFHHYSFEQVPAVSVNGVAARVIIGSAFGVTSPVKTFADTLLAEASLEAGQEICLPDAQERAVYVVDGNLAARDMGIPRSAMATFRHDEGVTLKATEDSRIVIIGGEPVGQRCIAWNFVSSRGERIDQAVEEWQAGKFAKVPGDEEAFLPFPGR
ncbi:pirin family protein [Microbulbifer yueqingensis]|uniref:Pirin n=1 Tax=Microbulbifer yueqingensis TaxID=658219 RepID=A0A1G8ZVD5_9GAMM|nr:pirin family protein [Microbulbifer yueqingensis]SDK19003.1 hypothetical protein SAMN05216212_1762 [Microbulbifer yueqingensis]